MLKGMHRQLKRDTSRVRASEKLIMWHPAELEQDQSADICLSNHAASTFSGGLSIIQQLMYYWYSVSAVAIDVNLTHG